MEGIYRNIPVNTALSRGFKEIIRTRPKRIRMCLPSLRLRDWEEVKYLVIKPREFYGDVLDFDPEIARNFQERRIS